MVPYLEGPSTTFDEPPIPASAARDASRIRAGVYEISAASNGQLASERRVGMLRES